MSILVVWITLVCSLYKTFGETFITDDYFLATAFSIGSIANALARIGWGYLTDKTSFQVSLSSATCLATVLLLTMPLTAYLGKFAYLLWVRSPSFTSLLSAPRSS